MKNKFGLISLIFLFTLSIVFFGWYYLTPVEQRDVYDFVPKDAIYILESDRPVQNWKDFSDSDIWTLLRSNSQFETINNNAKYLDSLMEDNRSLFKLIGERKLLISAHMTSSEEYEFLYVADLKRGAKIAVFKDLVHGILNTSGIDFEVRDWLGQEILEIKDSDGEAILMAFADNVLICSYSSSILKKAMEQGNDPHYSRNPQFNHLKNHISNSGLAQIYIDYNNIQSYLELYFNSSPNLLNSLSKTLRFGAFDWTFDDEQCGFEGSINIQDSIPSILNSLQNVSASKIRATEILPPSTSIFLCVDFESFPVFYEGIERSMKLDTASWEEYNTLRNKTEKKLDISFEENLFSWIGKEIAVALVPLDSTGTEQTYVAVFHVNDAEDAIENLDFVTKKIKKNTPVKFKKEKYKGHTVRYLEMKGFFKLFFGKLMNKFEKPHFIQLDDYVVFANDTSTLHRMIDNFEQHISMESEDNFEEFMDHFSRQSNYFSYVNTEKLFPFLPEFFNGESALELRNNERLVKAFPMIGLQLKQEDGRYDSEIFVTFRKPESLSE